MLDEAFYRALGELTPREEQVLRMHYGIDNIPTCTLKEIGQRFGVTRERIRQVEVKALLKLYKLLQLS